jgi:transposase-like protein
MILLDMEPATFEEFQRLFGAEEDCIQFLFQNKWPSGFICSRCEHTQAYKICSRRLPLYECSSCHYQSSLTSGTVMEGSRTELRKWFLALFLVSRTSKGTNAVELSSALKVTYKTAWLILSKIRCAISQADASILLSGIVRVNTAIYGCPHNPSVYRHPKQQPLLIGATMNNQSEPLLVKMKHLHEKHRDWSSLFLPGAKAFIDQHIDPQTTNLECITGRYRSNRLKNLTKTVSQASKWINETFHSLGPKHLQKYLDEFCYRLNHTIANTPIFLHLSRLCATSPTITYANLICP